MNVAIIGNTLDAYVAAVSLASVGNRVVLSSGFNNTDLIESSYLHNEPELTQMLDMAEKSSNLTVVNDQQFDSKNFDCFWLFYKGSSQDQIEEQIEKLSSENPNSKFLLTTTLGVGTYEQLESKYIDMDLEIAVIPSFVREGYAISDFKKPDLLLIGTKSSKFIALISKLLSEIIERSRKVMFVSAAEAEFIKTSICSVLASRLSLINELSGLAEGLNIDINTVVEGMASDARVGKYYLQPGCGFGGVTLSREVNNLLKLLSETSSSGSSMLSAVVETNNSQKELLFRKFWQYRKGKVSGAKISIWGASFKPNTSSIKNSPIHEMIEAFSSQNCIVSVYDPAASEGLTSAYSNLEQVKIAVCKEDAAKDADALFILTDWDEFLRADYFQISKLMARPVIFDGRNMLDYSEMQELGFEYFGVGRGRPLTEIIDG